MGFKKIFIYIFLMVLALIICLWLFRAFSGRQADDLNPFIACEKDIIDKSETLMIIPIFEGKSIAENKSWCENILLLNKTLGMHGVYHSYREFKELRNESYVVNGMEEFRKCFGRYPDLFEAPQLVFTRENSGVLKELGLKFRGYTYSITHKVYHCGDSGKYSNRFVDFF